LTFLKLDSGDCLEQYNAAGSLTLEAEPEDGYTFSRWENCSFDSIDTCTAAWGPDGGTDPRTWTVKATFNEKNPPVQAAEYTYNALGQRITKKVGNDVTIFQYDLQGQLIAEIDATTEQPLRQHVHVGNEPFAQLSMINGEIEVQYVHSDHLGTPTLLTNEDQQVVADIEATPFGETFIDYAEVVYNRRFPGQYRDGETGLSYNYFRDYDPSTGRYVQSDPIGLGGGLGTYSYVNGNPVNATDPEGLYTLAILHWTRNYWNDNVNNIDDVSRWTELTPAESVFHQMGPGNENNRKFVSPDGHGEAVFSCENEFVSDPANYGTFNYFGPRVLWGIPHVMFDVIPYFLFGNTPSDMFKRQRFDTINETYLTKSTLVFKVRQTVLCMAAVQGLSGCCIESHRSYAFSEASAKVGEGKVVARLRGTMKRTSGKSSEMGSPYELILLYTLDHSKSLEGCSIVISELNVVSLSDGKTVLSNSVLTQELTPDKEGKYTADFLGGQSALNFENHQLKFAHHLTGDCQHRKEGDDVELVLETNYSEKAISLWDVLMGV